MTQAFPLSLLDASLVFAVAAIVLLVTSEIISPYYGGASLRIDKRRLKNAALAMSALFLFTVAIRIVSVIFGF